MIILYKVCFNSARDDVLSSTPGARPIVSNIQEMISVCVKSVVKQMSKTDKIIFFLDGEDIHNTLENICTKYDVKFSIKSFNHGCAVKTFNETVLHIINEIDNEEEDIYLCEDDYLHYNNCLSRVKEFLNKYPTFFCHPTDYPNLYSSEESYYGCNNRLESGSFKQQSEIITTNKHHWRRVKSTTMTFAFKKKMFTKYYNIFTNMSFTLFWEHMHNIMYVFDECYSPIPSLASHLERKCLPPCIDTKKEYNKIKKC